MGRARYSFWLAEPRKYSEAFTLPQPQRTSGALSTRLGRISASAPRPKPAAAAALCAGLRVHTEAVRSQALGRLAHTRRARAPRGHNHVLPSRVALG